MSQYGIVASVESSIKLAERAIQESRIEYATEYLMDALRECAQEISRLRTELDAQKAENAKGRWL